MKPILALLIGILPLILAVESDTASLANPLIGIWVLDVAKTKESRKNLKEPPAGMDFKPTPEEVRARTLVFSEHTLSLGTQTSNSDFTYSILKTEGNSVLVKYSPSKEGSPVYCWWEFPSPDTAINYMVVFDLNSPFLASKEVASFYQRKKD
ncbi:hypothetical protein [Geminisphaera colitermitum]|uniref:hypothetical protein n=1 Tax=Geminisphaera colitermitum TaxID=1148786 RepID=UPI0001964FE6|nr:hypothetical protein [Geminisphaera colitermitum]